MADQAGPSATDPSTRTSTGTQEDNLIPPKKGFFARFKKTPVESSDNNDPGDDNKPPLVKFTALFRFATRNERILMAVACINAAIHGGMLPVFTILFGGIINNFEDLELDLPVEEITNEVGGVAKWFLILGGVAFVTSLIQVRLQLIVAHRVCARLRRKFFESLMSQDYTWVDQNDGGELTARVAGDVNLIQAGIGDKVTSAVQFMSMFFIGVIVAFVYGPLLTLVILSVAPLLVLAGGAFAKMASASTGDGLGAYGAAGAVANEAISLIRSVTAYGGQESEARRYEKELQTAYKADVKKAIFSGLGMGITFFIIFSTYAVAFVFGAWRVREMKLKPGDVLTTFFSVFIACISIGQGEFCFFFFSSLLADGHTNRRVRVRNTFARMSRLANLLCPR